MYERRGAYYSTIRRILGYLKLAADPLPIAPARLEQECFAWASPETSDADREFEHEPGPGASGESNARPPPRPERLKGVSWGRVGPFIGADPRWVRTRTPFDNSWGRAQNRLQISSPINTSIHANVACGLRCAEIRNGHIPSASSMSETVRIGPIWFTSVNLQLYTDGNSPGGTRGGDHELDRTADTTQ
jgi:hypothetical protein